MQVRRETLDGTVLAAEPITLDAAPRSVVLLELSAELRVPDDPGNEVLVAEAIDPVSGALIREVHCWVEDIDLRLDPDPLDVVVEPIDDGYLVTVRARSLVKDLTLLVDRIDPAATVDKALVTLPAGASATVQVRTTVRGAERELAGTPVLRTANDLAAKRNSGDPVGASTERVSISG